MMSFAYAGDDPYSILVVSATYNKAKPIMMAAEFKEYGEIFIGKDPETQSYKYGDAIYFSIKPNESVTVYVNKQNIGERPYLAY